MKSRFASLKPIAKSVKDAQEMYYHRNGRYATQSELADLDVGIPEGTSIDISAEGDHQYIRANHTGLPHNSYTAYLDRSSNFAGNIYCEAYTGDVKAEQLCMAEGGTAGPVNGEYTLYLLSGNSTGEFGSAAFSSPSNAFATVYRYMVEECAQTGRCSNGLRKALAGEGYEGYDTSYSTGSADNPIVSIELLAF